MAAQVGIHQPHHRPVSSCYWVRAKDERSSERLANSAHIAGLIRPERGAQSSARRRLVLEPSTCAGTHHVPLSQPRSSCLRKRHDSRRSLDDANFRHDDQHASTRRRFGPAGGKHQGRFRGWAVRRSPRYAGNVTEWKAQRAQRRSGESSHYVVVVDVLVEGLAGQVRVPHSALGIMTQPLARPDAIRRNR